LVIWNYVNYVDYVNVGGDVYMTMFVLWWYLYTCDDGDEMKMIRTSWWFHLLMTILVIVIMCELYALNFVIPLMMMTFLSILLRWWLCLFEMIRWEYMWTLYVMKNMCNWRCKRGLYVIWWEEMWWFNYVVIGLIEVVMFGDEFC